MPEPAVTPRPLAPRRRRPSPEAVAAARGERRRSGHLFVASLVWAVVASIGLAVYDIEFTELPLPWAIGVFVPGVAAGVAAGRRVWPAYLPVAILTTILVLLPGAALIPITCATILVVGYGLHAAWTLLTRERIFDAAPPEADAPRLGGGALVDEDATRMTRPVSVRSSIPDGRELRKRWR